MSKMNAKMNKLALCALLSVGVLSAVSAELTVKQLLQENDVGLFNELKTREACERAYRRVQGELSEVERKLKSNPGEKTFGLLNDRGRLLRLAERLNFVCTFWVWFAERGIKLQESDVKRILSEGVSGEDDLESLEKLQFLRNADWGEDLTSSKTKEGLQRLRSMYEKII